MIAQDRGSGLRERLGLPAVSGRRCLLAAAIIDSLGTGLFVPFAVVYFLNTTRLSLTTVGLGLSAASALALLSVPLLGSVVDRFGAVPVILLSNLVQLAGFVAYLWVTDLWQLIVFALVVSVGQSMFWTANGAMVDLAADPGDRPRWFSMMRALRNGGLAMGGALASAAVAFGGRNGYHALALVNAVSFLAAGLLIAAWARTSKPRRAARQARTQQARTQQAPTATGQPGYRAVLADRAFLLLTAINFVFVLCTFVITVLLSVYLTRSLHRPAWLAGLLFTLSAILVVGVQTLVTRRTERHRATRMLQLAGALWAFSFVLMWAAAAVPAPVAITGLIIAIVCYTGAETVCLPTVSVLALALAPPQRQGRYFAVQQLAWSGARVVAPAAFTWLLGRGEQWPWVALILACAVTSLALVKLRHMLPADLDLPSHPRPAGPAPGATPARNVPLSAEPQES